jgi:hypothetical protein
MSIVAVHGPNTMYTTEGGGASIASSPAGAQATKSPTDGLTFNFSFPNPGARPAADFDWTFTGPGSPAAQNDKTSGSVTFTGPGAVTIICTVAAGAGPPAAGAYTVTSTTTAGTPRMVEPEQQAAQQAAQGENVPEDDTVYDETTYGEFILADHSVAEVQSFLGHYDLSDDNIDDLITEEEEGANRPEMIDWLNTLRA